LCIFCDFIKAEALGDVTKVEVRESGVESKIQKATNLQSVGGNLFPIF
jgi:hypothetical protein